MIKDNVALGDNIYIYELIL